MTSKRRVATAIIPFLIAGAVTTTSVVEANASTLTCTTTTGNTGGTATCKGTGVWRIHLDCVADIDQVGPWTRQSGGTLKQSAGRTCAFKNRKTTVEKL